MSTYHTVIVVDDNPKFAHHVWRHLTQAFEYGFAAEMRPGSTATFPRQTSPDGRLTVEWHNPFSTSQQDADALLDTFKTRVSTLRREPDHEVWALIDVYGVGMPGAHQWQDYAREFLVGASSVDRLKMVSSYSRHVNPIPMDARTKIPVNLHAKSPEVLWKLRDALVWEAVLPVPTRTDEQKAIHVLITGAGFELRSKRGHGEKIGIPETAELLRRGGALREVPLASNKEEKGYPVPAELADRLDLLAEAAKPDLDQYWEQRLVEVRAISKRANPSPEIRTRIDAAELAARETFRMALLQHDVGHLAQALWAAQLDWSVWLSTNYTQFADRALAFVKRTTPSDQQLRDWRTIATTLEVDTLPTRLADASPEERRWMVKLHGDIALTQSMALAASDKESSSRFLVKPRLDKMYDLAEKLLIQRLRSLSSHRPKCYWHMVGHALRDKTLFELLKSVQDGTAKTTHIVTVVAPDAPYVVAEALKEGRLIRDARRIVEPLAATAISYLAQLRRLGLPADDNAYATLLASVRDTAAH